MLQLFAIGAEGADLRVELGDLAFDLGALGLVLCGLLLFAGDELLLLRARDLVAVGGSLPLLDAALDASGFGFHLAESGAGVGGLTLGVAALVVLAVESRGEGR